MLARALGLVVGDDRPPAAYRAALREYGLAVEMKLPPGHAPISEHEVRELLATGFGR
ncbi:MAG: hypothetical protein N3A53_08045 [Verrucomicrobiae bacterium]|nr:hypothetical protein [Verrucomicrobiae bacterium]